MTVIEPRAPKVSANRSIPTFYKLLVGGQLTRGRVAALVTLGAISVLLAVVARISDETEEVGVEVFASYSIGLLIPLAALLLATPILGNIIEDRLLVYLWMKPVPRWHLAVAAYAAVVSVLLPAVVVPVLATVIITGIESLIVPALVASVLGVLAYSSIYLFNGARFGAGLWIGLLYLVMWENVVSSFGDGVARLSIRSYILSIVRRGIDQDLAGFIEDAERAQWSSYAMPVGAAVVFVVLTARVLTSRDID